MVQEIPHVGWLGEIVGVSDLAQSYSIVSFVFLPSTICLCRPFYAHAYHPFIYIYYPSWLQVKWSSRSVILHFAVAYMALQHGRKSQKKPMQAQNWACKLYPEIPSQLPDLNPGTLLLWSNSALLHCASPAWFISTGLPLCFYPQISQ